jgi:hypothetical protein
VHDRGALSSWHEVACLFLVTYQLEIRRKAKRWLNRMACRMWVFGLCDDLGDAFCEED